jgi:hypothetical protein
MEKIQEVEKRLRQGLSEKEVGLFFMLMDKIKRNLEEENTG